MGKNIKYQSDKIALYFSENRVLWEQFYESERTIIKQLNLTKKSTILDIGCACGGLGLVLHEQFGVEKYTGVDINPFAAESAGKINSNAQIYCGDILELSKSILHQKQFDVVFSLSCMDWNVQFDEMLASAWEFVQPGGRLVATFRLTSEEGCKDIRRSYQYINFEGVMYGEIANYVVLNVNEILHQILGFNPLHISAYGYWGAPSNTAVTPFEKICFSAFAIIKRGTFAKRPVKFNLDLPKDICEILNEPF